MEERTLPEHFLDFMARCRELTWTRVGSGLHEESSAERAKTGTSTVAKLASLSRRRIRGAFDSLD